MSIFIMKTVADYPEIVREWHPTKNNIIPQNVNAGSDKKYWFQCQSGHDWYARVRERTQRNKQGCPYCAGQKVCLDNCLATLFPAVAAEWHPTKNGNIAPRDVVAGSGRKYWFQCEKGHEWETRLVSRTSSKQGCPICNESKGEKKVSEILTRMGVRFKRQYKFLSCRHKKPLLFDFVIKNNCVKVIEYQGEQHYKITDFGSTESQERLEQRFQLIKKRDEIKRLWCAERNVQLLEIPYWDYNIIEELIKQFI